MTESRPSIADKRRVFRQLHASGCFLIPNPWDVGSARYLQSLGFKALATTSSGFRASNSRLREAAKAIGIDLDSLSPEEQGKRLIEANCAFTDVESNFALSNS